MVRNEPVGWTPPKPVEINSDLLNPSKEFIDDYLSDSDTEWRQFAQSCPGALQLLAPQDSPEISADALKNNFEKDCQMRQKHARDQNLAEQLRQPTYDKLYQSAGLQPGELYIPPEDHTELLLVNGVTPKYNTVLMKFGDKYILSTSDTGADYCLMRKGIADFLGWTDPTRLKKSSIGLLGIGMGTTIGNHVYLADFDIGGQKLQHPVILVDDAWLPTTFLLGEDFHRRFTSYYRSGDRIQLRPCPPKPYQMLKTKLSVYSSEDVEILPHQIKLIKAECWHFETFHPVIYSSNAQVTCSEKSAVNSVQIDPSRHSVKSCPSVDLRHPQPSSSRPSSHQKVKKKKKKSPKRKQLDFQETNLMMVKQTEIPNTEQNNQNLERPRLHPDELRRFRRPFFQLKYGYPYQT